MTGEAPFLLVRAASVYLATACALVAWAWRRPSRRAVAGAALATAWNLPALLALHLAAQRFGWWQFDARGGLLLGMPVDVYLAWACLWGLVPALAFPALPLVLLVALAFAVDLALMPAAAPVLTLGPAWLAGEIAGLLGAFVPAQLLARWTARDERLGARAALQVVAFAGLVLFVIPAAAVEASASTWRNPLAYPAWQLSLLVQALAIPAGLGLTAVQEFVERGRGTPVPFDPPRRLVTTGVYAYVGNPMQVSGVLTLVVLGLVLRSAWIAAAGVLAHVYSMGLAGWDEEQDLRARFAGDWTQYRGAVRRWIPRWRPWWPPDRPPARLFVASRCDMCRQVGAWFARRAPRGLAIVAAESHPSGALTRVTYEPPDGSRAAAGIEAIARALEHTHLGWASLGFVLRLPLVRPLVQLLVDASGGEPRPAARARRIAG